MTERRGKDSQAVHRESTPTTVSASAHVDAPPAAVFDYLRRPANHAAISGDETVKQADGPELLELGSEFGARMKLGPVPYGISNKVVEFEPDRLIAWSHFGGHRWRWEVVADGDGSRVTETFDQSTARPVIKQGLGLFGYPSRHADNVAASVANVVARFAAGSTPG